MCAHSRVPHALRCAAACAWWRRWCAGELGGAAAAVIAERAALAAGWDTGWPVLEHPAANAAARTNPSTAALLVVVIPGSIPPSSPLGLRLASNGREMASPGAEPAPGTYACIALRRKRSTVLIPGRSWPGFESPGTGGAGWTVETVHLALTSRRRAAHRSRPSRPEPLGDDAAVRNATQRPTSQ